MLQLIFRKAFEEFIALSAVNTFFFFLQVKSIGQELPLQYLRISLHDLLQYFHTCFAVSLLARSIFLTWLAKVALALHIFINFPSSHC